MTSTLDPPPHPTYSDSSSLSNITPNLISCYYPSPKLSITVISIDMLDCYQLV